MSHVPPPGAVPPRAARCWTLVSGDGAIDVEVTARDRDTVGDVVPVLARALGVPVSGLWAGSASLPADVPLDAPELAHGAVLGVERPAARPHPGAGPSALELHVVGGRDAGRTAPLAQGRHVLGRGAEASVRFDDPDVSRRHAAVQVSGGEITVTDLGSTNGSRLDGHDLTTDARAWTEGALLQLGASALTVRGPAGPRSDTAPSAGGRTRLRPVPRLTVPSPDLEVLFPREPTPAPPRRLAWVAVALPAVAGAGMAWALHAPTFLFFALLSPVVALGTWLGDRWSGRRTGRRQRARYAVELAAAEDRLAAAVRASVRAAEEAHPDLATVTTAARRRSERLWSRRLADADALTVRVGAGPGETGARRVNPDGSRLRVPAERMPVAVDLRSTGGLGIVGPREPALGVLSAVLAQLTALHPPGDVELVLLTRPDRLDDWSWARWLPHLDPGSVHVGATEPAGSTRRADEAVTERLAALVAGRRARTRRTDGSPAAAVASPLVVVVDRAVGAALAATLRGGRDVGVLTLALAEAQSALSVHVDAVLRLTGETGDAAVLSRHGLPDRDRIAVDRLSRATAGDFARDLAGLARVASAGSLPRTVRLLDLPAGGVQVDADGGVSGTWSRERNRLVATLGRSADAPVEVDLCREGPHALVAGTTGSGKSELLQTLIAGLALRHPPDRCSFLLVDYKGGAAFAEAASLPHTVGLVTDLDGQTTARALRSLAAELTRREAVLGAHQVSDISGLPADVPLTRLVIVVDEFATLAEELPGFVPGLVSIAQRGRSLGVHLVLATQRPAGVVSPEIRANCTLRLCLRTTDEADSRDVLGSPEAAHLPVDRPGRAFLRVGSADPVALQVARVATAPPAADAAGPEVRRWLWPAGAPRQDAEPSAEDSDLARIVRSLTEHARSGRTPLPHRPWRPPLPDELPVASLDARAGEDGDRRLRLGLVDHPDRQAQEPLELDLAVGGGWLAVGGPRSGRTTMLRTVLAEAVHRLGPDDLHVHVIDAGAGALAEEAARLPHTGTSIGGPDALRTVRLVDRLAREVADRRTAGGTASGPVLLLLVDGVDAVSALLDEADPVNGAAALVRLVRDGAAAGLTCVLTADRAVPGGRLAAAVRQRVVLPLPDRADYAVAGVPARAVPAHRPPGRALVGEEAVECQLALPRPLATWPEGASARALGPSPLRIAELAPDPVLPLPPPRTIDADGSLWLPIGPGADEGAPLAIDLLRTGGLLVTGPPGSGRSAALDAFARHLQALGTPLLRIGRPPRAAEGKDRPTADGVTVDWVESDDVTATARWLGDRPDQVRVVIADDVGTPAETPALDALPALGSRMGVVLLAAGGAGPLGSHYHGPVVHLRRGRSGVLLCPMPGDAEVLGLRLPRMPLPVRPGSGWLVTGGRPERVQVARRREPLAGGPVG